MSLIAFLKSNTFRIHFLIALVAGIVLLWFSLKLLDVYTRHGKTIVVPDLSGLQAEEATRKLDEMNLRAIINDSIFDSNREKGAVASQNPMSGVEVKRNRAIYLTTVAILPEMVSMPDLTDLSFRQAQSLLHTYGLEVGQMEYVPNLARNAVLQQKYKNGTIQPGTPVEKGTRIDLVLGTGHGSSYVNVPLVIGKTREEALRLINASSLNVGEEVFLDQNEANPMVFRQSPNVIEGIEQLEMGSTIDLFYRSADEFDFEEYTNELLGIETPDLTGKTPWEVIEILERNLLILGEEVFENGATTQNARVYKQLPDANEQPKTLKGTEVDIWYRPAQE